MDFSHQHPIDVLAFSPSRGYLVALLIAVYLVLVNAFRWRRYNNIHAKYGKKFKEEKQLTPEEAHDVLTVSLYYDMPLLLNYAVAFALFKTYAIPTISKLLYTTKELAASENVSKRYADTEIFITTWTACPISGQSVPGCPMFQNERDPRPSIALARVNWLHSKYHISNDDFLYTLTLFILEPSTWARRYGWRPLSPIEEYAYYRHWTNIGSKMDIRDIPGTLEDLKRWSLDYETRCMVPADTNNKVATYTTEEILFVVPERFGLKSLARRMSICLLDEKVRIAMMQPEQPAYLRFVTRFAIRAVHAVQYYFCLPRMRSEVMVPLDMSLNVQGRMYPTRWQSTPWYKPQSKFLVWDKLLVKLGLSKALPSQRYRSSGYRLDEMGPLKYENSGQEEVMRMAESIYGGPITAPWHAHKQ